VFTRAKTHIRCIAFPIAKGLLTLNFGTSLSRLEMNPYMFAINRDRFARPFRDTSSLVASRNLLATACMPNCRSCLFDESLIGSCRAGLDDH
jgi:hypothetical protein